MLGAGLLSLAPPSATRAERIVPFHVGETLSYDVSWSSYLTAGTAVATVESKQPAGNSLAYQIVAEGRPIALVSRLYTLHYKIDTLLDSYTLLPNRASVYIEEGSRKRTQPEAFDRQKAPNVMDALAALYVLRASALTPGAELSMPVLQKGVLYTVRCSVGEADQVSAAGGTISAWPVRLTAADPGGRPAGRNMAIWISTDRRRLPVRLQADLPVGTFNLVLREAK